MKNSLLWNFLLCEWVVAGIAVWNFRALERAGACVTG
jgi:hypothetical protein